MPENWSTFLSSQSGQLILLVGALTLAFLVLRASVAKLQKIVAETETEADDTILSFVRKFYGIVLGTILLIGVLRIFNVDVSPLLASAGIAGIVIGLAVKEVVADMLAGVFILADRPFAERDRIQVEKPSGHWGGWGDVKKIGLRRTRVLNTDGVVVNYPNSELIQSTIINFSDTNDHHDPVRVRVRFCVDWSADLDKVSALAEEAIVRGIQKAAGLAKPLRVAEIHNALPILDNHDDPVLDEEGKPRTKNTTPVVIVRSIWDDKLGTITPGVLMEGRYFLTNIRDRTKVRSIVLQEILKSLNAAGIQMPQATAHPHTVHAVGD